MTSLMQGERTRVLCVDDEPMVLEGLSLHLRRRYQVLTATGGAAGLEILAREPGIAVVVSDMRMPGMDGAAFLGQTRQRHPDTVRILLTGQSDFASAVAAVNEGQIFRFLSKPCPTPSLLAAIESAAEQYRLVSAEKVLLEQTLHGSIKALTDVLALTNPTSFGRATRIKQLVSELAEKLGIRDRWQVEVAAMFSQLGYVTLPPEVAEKVCDGRLLNEAEQRLVSRAQGVTEQLLHNIPRIEAVREILAAHARPLRRTAAAGGGKADPKEEERRAAIDRGAQLLRLAVDFDALETSGLAAGLAIDTLRGRADRYDADVVQAAAELRAAGVAGDEVREMSLSGLAVGMVLAEDLKAVNGTLLVARGYEITDSFVERVRNLRAGTVREPVRVIVRRAVKSAAVS